jgi:hypothetical protein
MSTQERASSPAVKVKYRVKYFVEYNIHEVISDFMDGDGVSISTGNSDPKNRPSTEVTLITFDEKSEAVKFAEYYSQNCCHSMLKPNTWVDGVIGGDVVSWLTIQDHHLYEGLTVEEVAGE